LFFRLGFRHPAVFFLRRHPFRFVAGAFFQLDFFTSGADGAAANEALEPATNIRPMMSAMASIHSLSITIPLPVPCPPAA